VARLSGGLLNFLGGYPAHPRGPIYGKLVPKELAGLIDGRPLFVPDLIGQERRTGVVRRAIPHDMGAPPLNAARLKVISE